MIEFAIAGACAGVMVGTLVTLLCVSIYANYVLRKIG